jgi:vancomycin aglycone glucosyltransferase
MGVAYSQELPAEENRKLWMEEEQSFNELFGDALNEQRAALGLAPVSNVVRYITTDYPWLAADPVLGPAGTPVDMTITQTGAWLLTDPAALPEPLEEFLAAGKPPIYFGFGSMHASEHTGDIMVEAARALGRRAIISQGWAGLSVKDAGADCISIGGVNHEKLLPHVAAVVHHGGAGTTTAAARAGKPQVVVPRTYDQFYWAHRVQTLGVGVSSLTADNLTVDGLVAALREVLKPETADCAAELAGRIELNGARIAAERLTATFA